MTDSFLFHKCLPSPTIKKQSYADYFDNKEDAFCIPISYFKINLIAAVYICFCRF